MCLPLFVCWPGLDLKLECIEAIEFVIPWKNTTITMEGPIAVATGGTPPYSVNPDPDMPITVTGYLEGVSTNVYEVVDGAGNSALCQPSLLLLKGSERKYRSSCRVLS